MGEIFAINSYTYLNSRSGGNGERYYCGRGYFEVIVRKLSKSGENG